MSLFGNFSGNDKNQTNSDAIWSFITDSSQLDEITNESFEKLVVIFKHSMRCHISRSALRQFEKEFDSKGKIAPYFLDLLEYRNISNEIASRFGVIHQSPQIIVIKDGKAIYNASHERIDAGKLEPFL